MDGQNYPGNTILPTAAAPSSVQSTQDLGMPTNGGGDYGLQFQSILSGKVTGLRFWRSTSMNNVDGGQLWGPAGQLLATASFANPSYFGWQYISFSTPVSIQANSTYTIAFHLNANGISSNVTATASYLSNGNYNRGVLRWVSNGVVGYSSSPSTAVRPTSTTFNGNTAPFFWIEPVFTFGQNFGSLVQGNYIHDAWWPRQGGTPVRNANAGSTGGQLMESSHDGIRLDGGGPAPATGVTVSSNVAGETPVSAKVPATADQQQTFTAPPNEPITAGPGYTVNGVAGTVASSGQNLVTGDNNPASASAWTNIVIAAGITAYREVFPGAATSAESPTIQLPTPFISTALFTGYAVSSIPANEKLTYWVNVPETGMYDFGLGDSTNASNDAVAVAIDSSTVLASAPLANTGGTISNPVVGFSRTQPFYLMSGFHKFDLTFSGTMTNLEFAGFYLTPDLGGSPALLPASTSGIPASQLTVPDSNNPWWGGDISFTSVGQSATLWEMIPEKGAYSVELRTATQSNSGEFRISLYGSSGNSINVYDKGLPVTAFTSQPVPNTHGVGIPISWVIYDKSLGGGLGSETLGSATQPLAAGLYKLQITYVPLNNVMTSPVRLQTVNLIDQIWYPLAGN